MKNVRPELDKRKAFILSTIVYEYIATAEPVGSNTLTQKYSLGVSSATIRSEMAELEALGYLMQPHTSSGRIPSDAGYRIYVDQLMRPETLTTEEQRRIQDEFRAASRELDGVIEQTTRLLGQLSRNVAFAIAPQRNTQTFRHLQLIWLGEQTALAVIVTSLGAGTQRLFEHSGVADAEDLTRMTNRLNARLGGKTLREISEIDVAAIVRESGAPEDLALAVQTALHNVGIAGDPLITSSGAQHLLDQPEFQDLRKLRSILRIIEEQKTLYDLVADSADGEKASVKIGQELALDDVTECSVVTVPYRMGDGVVGLLAILGPRRMNYGRLLALATGTAASLNDHLRTPKFDRTVPTDFYAVLGVERGATEAEIKSAYRSLARRHHPDVADDQDKAAAEARFKEINAAYEVLSDQSKRQNYDRYGSPDGGQAGGFGGGFGGGAEGFTDLFDMFFGQARAGTQQRGGPGRGADLRYDLEIRLEEAFRGTEREIAFNHLANCDVCEGSGAKPGTNVSTCRTCNGTGISRQVRQTPLGQFVTQSTCQTCGGEGRTIATPCDACRGAGRLERTRSITVKIPVGVDDGSRIRISGAGEAGARGGPAGDLYVYLRVAPHERFRRDGQDLYFDQPITFSQAALGAEVDVDSMEGPLDLKVPAGTQSGASFRMRGRGMPGVRGNSRGDQIVTVHVVVPTKLSRRERELLEEFAKLSGDRIDERSFLDRFKDAFLAD